jgi:protein N-lysine methyltransferase METTL21A
VAKGCEGFQKPIYITDQKPMLKLMEHNIELNDLHGVTQAVVYNWGEPKPSDLPTQTDIVLAADCVYFEPAFPLLQATLRDILGENTVCYFCFKKRRRADLQFIKTAKKMFNVTEVQDNHDKEIYSKENIFLYVHPISNYGTQR